MRILDALPVSGDKASCDDGRSFCISERLRKGATSIVHIALFRKIRGNFRSVPMERLIKEARRAGRARGQRTDPGGTGDDTLWKRSVW